MKLKEILAVSTVALGVFALVGCAQVESIFSTVTASAPQLTADVAALCKAIPDLSTTAQTVLKGGAANSALTLATQAQSDCNGAVATAPSILTAINAISSAITAANAAATPAPAAK